MDFEEFLKETFKYVVLAVCGGITLLALSQIPFVIIYLLFG